MGKNAHQAEALHDQLPAKRRFDLRQVMIAVPQRVILDEKLARERSVTIERNGRRAIQFLIAQSSNRSRSRRAVRREESEGRDQAFATTHEPYSVRVANILAF